MTKADLTEEDNMVKIWIRDFGAGMKTSWTMWYLRSRQKWLKNSKNSFQRKPGPKILQRKKKPRRGGISTLVEFCASSTELRKLCDQEEKGDKCHARLGVVIPQPRHRPFSRPIRTNATKHSTSLDKVWRCLEPPRKIGVSHADHT